VTRELTEKAQAEGKPPPQLGDPTALRSGPSAAREQELLTAWKQR
jgi:hypothetical protein